MTSPSNLQDKENNPWPSFPLLSESPSSSTQLVGHCLLGLWLSLLAVEILETSLVFPAPWIMSLLTTIEVEMAICRCESEWPPQHICFAIYSPEQWRVLAFSAPTPYHCCSWLSEQSGHSSVSALRSSGAIENFGILGPYTIYLLMAIKAEMAICECESCRRPFQHICLTILQSNRHLWHSCPQPHLTRPYPYSPLSEQRWLFAASANFMHISKCT